eukprot:682854-Amphidinium_carterae.1
MRSSEPTILVDVSIATSFVCVCCVLIPWVATCTGQGRGRGVQKTIHKAKKAPARTRSVRHQWLDAHPRRPLSVKSSVFSTIQCSRAA